MESSSSNQPIMEFGNISNTLGSKGDRQGQRRFDTSGEAVQIGMNIRKRASDPLAFSEVQNFGKDHRRHIKAGKSLFGIHKFLLRLIAHLSRL